MLIRQNLITTSAETRAITSSKAASYDTFSADIHDDDCGNRSNTKLSIYLVNEPSYSQGDNVKNLITKFQIFVLMSNRPEPIEFRDGWRTFCMPNDLE